MASSRRCANLAEHLAMVSAVTDKAAEKLRLGIMLRDIGFIACSDEIAHKDDTDPNLNEHTIRGLEIISGLNDELVEAIVRYHHSTLKSDDCPTDLSSDILRCVNIALACNRLEKLVTAQTQVRNRRHWRPSKRRRRRGTGLKRKLSSSQGCCQTSRGAKPTITRKTNGRARLSRNYYRGPKGPLLLPYQEAMKQHRGDARQRSPRHGKRAPEGPRLNDMEKEKGGARARQMRVERRPPVSGALLSHGLTPQYHRRSAA